MEKISFVIPCYRSMNTLPKVVEEVSVTMQNSGHDWELVMVNDCSPDETFSVISNICENNSNCTGINLSKNFGQHAAIMAGILETSGDIVVCLDDDGQTPADEVTKLIAEILNGSDAVYASYGSKKHSLFRNFGSNVNELMARWLLNKPKKLYISSYFAIKRFVADEIVKYDNSYPYLAGLVLRSTKNITNVEVAHREREEGASGYTIGKLLGLWFNGFTTFSVKPLRIATFMGALIAFAGFVFTIFSVISKFINPAVPLGWSSTMCALLVIGGMLMLMLGMVGEYIGRIYISINAAPQFVIREKVNFKNQK